MQIIIKLIIYTNITGEKGRSVCRLDNSPVTMFCTVAAVDVVLLVLSGRQAENLLVYLLDRNNEPKDTKKINVFRNP
jgi:hypothetical protein